MLSVSSISLSQQVNQNGCRDQGSWCPYLMVTMGKARSTPLAESNAIFNFATRTREYSHPPRNSTANTKIATCKSPTWQLRQICFTSFGAKWTERSESVSSTCHSCCCLQKNALTVTSSALIIFFSKSLLRHPLARSDISEFTGESHFKWLIPDPEHGISIKSQEECERVLICTGQVYAALHKGRQNQALDKVAITRVEQLHPFPWAQLRDNLDQYPNAKEIIWVQEEPLNAGAWTYVQPRLQTICENTTHHKSKAVKYAGRNPSASVATGQKATHLVGAILANHHQYSTTNIYNL